MANDNPAEMASREMPDANPHVHDDVTYQQFDFIKELDPVAAMGTELSYNSNDEPVWAKVTATINRINERATAAPDPDMSVVYDQIHRERSELTSHIFEINQTISLIGQGDVEKVKRLNTLRDHIQGIETRWRVMENRYERLRRLARRRDRVRTPR